MLKSRKLCPLAVAVGIFVSGVASAGTVNAPSCQLSDVQSSVSSASPGDTVVIPAGSCTWTGTLSITKPITVTGSGTANNAPSEFGAGTASTIITDNSGKTASLISVSGPSPGQFVRISLLDIEPTPNTQVGLPIVIPGQCNTSDCVHFRLDNIAWGKTNYWTYEPTLLTGSLVSTDNAFGVVDHNTVTPGTMSEASPEFVNINHTAWQGVGDNGDNSWATPDTFGTDQAVYLENNVVWLSGYMVTENEYPVNDSFGGGRIVGRFNQLTMSGVGAPFAYHGTETGGRSRSGRAFEIYGNSVACVDAPDNVFVGVRGGTGFVFGNTWTFDKNSGLNNVLSIETQRTWRATSWAQCNGLTPFDVNDGYTQVWTGAIAR